MNRRIRFRTYGGVRGREPIDSRLLNLFSIRFLDGFQTAQKAPGVRKVSHLNYH
jgi:hypothetical protein